MTGAFSAVKNKKFDLSRREILILAATLVLYYVVGQLFMRIDLFIDDSIYGQRIHTFDLKGILFPHHLVFHLIKLSIWKPLRMLFGNITSFQVGQQVNLLARILSGLYLFRIVWNNTRRFSCAYPTMLILLSSYSVWMYSMGEEPYTLVLCVMFIFYHYVLDILPDRENIVSYIFTGIIASVMMLIFQMTFLVAFGYIIFLLWKLFRRKVKFVYTVAAVLPMVVMTGGVYLAFAGVLGKLSSLRDFFAWFTHLAQKSLGGGFTLYSVKNSIFCFFKAFHYGVKVKNSLVYGSFGWDTPILITLLVIIGLGLAYIVVLVLRYLFRRKIWSSERYFFLVSSFIIFCGFIAWWQPEIIDYWQFPIAILLIVLGDSLSRLSKAVCRRAVYIFVGALFFANLWGEIYPHSRFADPPPTDMELARELVELGVDENTLLVSRTENVDGNILYLTDFEMRISKVYLMAFVARDEKFTGGAMGRIEGMFLWYWLNGGRIFIAEDDLLIPDGVFPSEWLYDREFLEDFIARFSDYFVDTGVKFHHYNRPYRLYEFDAQEYFGGNPNAFETMG